MLVRIEPLELMQTGPVQEPITLTTLSSEFTHDEKCALVMLCSVLIMDYIDDAENGNADDEQFYAANLSAGIIQKLGMPMDVVISYLKEHMPTISDDEDLDELLDDVYLFVAGTPSQVV